MDPNPATPEEVYPLALLIDELKVCSPSSPSSDPRCSHSWILLQCLLDSSLFATIQ